MSWLFLLIAGGFEVGFTTCLRYTEGFRNLPWTAGFLLCTAGSLIFLEFATRTIPLGTGYALWTGIGVLGTAVVGILFFQEPATPVRLLLMLGIAACVAGLKLTASH